MIPTLAYNMSAKLRLKTYDFCCQSQNFTLKVIGGEQPIYGRDLDANDWDKGNLTVATWNTTDYPGNDIFINLTVTPEQISKFYATQFRLVSNRDEQNIQPQSSEYISFYAGDSGGNEPRLEVTYYVNIVGIWGTIKQGGPQNEVLWHYRNASSNRAVIVLFGGEAYKKHVAIQGIDSPRFLGGEKSKEKGEFLYGLIEERFSILTLEYDDDWPSPQYAVRYEPGATWIENAAVWLLSNQSYENVFLFGFSAGGVAVAYEIQRDNATIYSGAVIASAPVDWDGHSNSSLYQTAHTANRTKVYTSFIAAENDTVADDPPIYTQMWRYCENMTIQHEWHNWTGGHDVFESTCADHLDETVTDVAVNWFSYIPVCAMKTKGDGHFYVPNIATDLLRIAFCFNLSHIGGLVGDQKGEASPYETIDVWPDGYVGIDDIIWIAEHFGNGEGDPNWHYMADVTADKYIGIDDITAASENFGIEGLYHYNLTYITITFNTDEEKSPGNDGFVAIPQNPNTTSFNVTLNGNPIGAIITFWCPSWVTQ